MARDMSDKDLLKMELDQLKVELKTEREPVSGCHDYIVYFLFVCFT